MSQFRAHGLIGIEGNKVNKAERKAPAAHRIPARLAFFCRNPLRIRRIHGGIAIAPSPCRPFALPSFCLDRWPPTPGLIHSPSPHLPKKLAWWFSGPHSPAHWPVSPQALTKFFNLRRTATFWHPSTWRRYSTVFAAGGVRTISGGSTSRNAPWPLQGSLS